VTDSEPAYRIHPARGAAVAVVASLPHSGEQLTAGMHAQLSPTLQHCLLNTDWFLPAVYAFLPELGVTMIEATHSRYVADPNRSPDGPQFGAFFRAVVAERTAGGLPVYSTPPAAAEIARRVARYHGAYHARLEALLVEARTRASRVLLLDLHSFMGPSEDDVCLGDARGRSCAPAVTARFAEALRAHGFGVAINAPFSGGYVVRHHGDAQQVHALQIELRYTNYLDCSHIERDRPTFDPERAATLAARLRAALGAAIAGFLDAG
jgi:N-formylglutamate deformylase